MISKYRKLLVFFVLFNFFGFNLKAQVEDQHMIDKLKAELPTLTNDTATVLQLINISFYYNLVNYDSAIFYVEKGFELATKMKFKLGIAHSHFVKGIHHYKAEKFEESLKDNLIANELYAELNDKRNIGATYTNMGIIYALGIDKQTAIEFYIKSLEISRQLNDSLGIAINLNNIGIMYQELKNYELAADYFKRTLEIDLDLGNPEDIAHSYNNLGELYLRHKKFDLAHTNLVTAHELINDVKDPDLQIEIFACLGEYYLETGKSDSALKFIDKALTAAQKANRKRNQAYNYFLAGRYLLLIKKYKPAIFHITEAIKLSDSIGVVENTPDYYRYISDAYSKINDFKNAHLNLQKSNEIHDKILFDELTTSLSNFEKQSELLRIQTEFQVEQQKKQNEVEKSELRLKLFTQFAIVIILFLLIIVIIFINNYRNKSKANKRLEEKGEIIEHQSEELKSTINHLEENEQKLEHLNATKDKFFSIIAHDLKNPFNVILGYSELLVNEPSVKSDQNKLDKITKSIHNTAELSYELLENLLTWSRSQTEGLKINFEGFNLSELIKSQTVFFKESATSKDIKISLDIDESLPVLGDQNMISTAIRNLLNNAIKFTKQGGKIEIISKQEGDRILFSVCDNGIGISPKDQQKLFRIDSDFKINGTDNESGTGLGLILCKEFITKNGGEISVQSEEGKGSIFTFTLPIAKTDE